KSESPSILTAMGICALALPHLPAELPPDKEPLVSKAGLAQYYMATRQMAEARKASEELIARFPDTPNVHYSFGVFLLGEDPLAALEERSEEHTSELQSLAYLVCRLLLEKKKKDYYRCSPCRSPR